MGIEQNVSADVTKWYTSPRVLAFCLGLSLVVNFVQYLVRQNRRGLHRALDSKSGMLTYDAWRRLGDREFAKAARRSQEVGVLMIDIDNLKLVNDRVGHLQGDEVLGSVAWTIRVSVRESDAVGRFGGDEFVVLLPSASRGACAAVAERIHAVVDQNAARHAPIPRDLHPITVSIGYAVFPADGASLEQLLERADQALYHAKQAGRNQTFRWRARPSADLDQS
jgi:diguanylate cyclase (GGDEF)-like protein